MQSDTLGVVEIFLNDEEMLYIFTDKIGKLSGEGELPHHEYSINYKEKLCIFNDFDIDETGEKIYTNFQI